MASGVGGVVSDMLFLWDLILYFISTFCSSVQLFITTPEGRGRGGNEGLGHTGALYVVM